MAYTDHVGDIFRVTAAFTMPNSQVQEIDLHYQIASAGAGDTRSNVLGYVDTGIGVYLVPTLQTTVAYYGVKISAIKSLAPFSPLVLYNGATGGSAGILLPEQSRGLVSWKTQYSGRAYRGRTYLPTSTASFNTTNGIPAAAYLTQAAGWATYQIAPIVAGGTTWIPGVYHKKPTAGISSVFDQFTSVLAGNRWATQRRGGALGRPNLPPF